MNGVAKMQHYSIYFHLLKKLKKRQIITSLSDFPQKAWQK